MSDHLTADLGVTALRTVRARREPNGLVIVHADRGSQFRAHSFQAVLQAAGQQGSKGSMESFWDLFQPQIFNARPWRTRAELHHAITYWIEHTFKRRRHLRGLGRLLPVEIELAFTSDTTQAAAWVTKPA